MLQGEVTQHSDELPSGALDIDMIARLWWKRALDLTVIGVLAVPGALLAFGIALGIRLRIGRPVLFVQERLGRQGRAFQILKFRTMRAVDSNGALSDEARLSPLGRWLRAWSLDELPQLWNVLKGDMSLVGPRPLLPEYLPLYSPEQARRMEVPPGITGWAQIHGRNALSWEERFAMDVWYVDHASFALDLRILFRTVGMVLRREGINQPGQATMERFRGNS